MNARQAQRHAIHDAQPTQLISMRGQAEHQSSPRPAAALEGKTDGAEERSASRRSSRISVSSSGSQTQSASATARATKRYGRDSAEVHSSAKKRSGVTNAEVGTTVDDSLRKSPPVSPWSRSVAVLDKRTTSVEHQQVLATNDEDSLTTARPMDRYDRVERYLEHSNMPSLPPTNIDEKGQQSHHHRRHKYSSQTSGSVDDAACNATVEAVRVAMPPKLRRDATAQSNSENESDNNQIDIEEDTGRKQHRRSDGRRLAKKRRPYRSPTDHIKYSFPPFNDRRTEKKRKHRSKQRYESSSSFSASSTEDSVSGDETPSPPPKRAPHKRHVTVDQRRQRRHRAVSDSSSDGSSVSSQSPDERQRTDVTVVGGSSIDPLMPTRNHRLPKSMATSKHSPVGHGRRSHNQGRSAAMTKRAEIRHDENDNMINEADKEQRRKYLAELCTLNMLQKMKAAKKRRSKRRRDNDDDDDDDAAERQNTFHHHAPTETISGDKNATAFDSVGHSMMNAESYPTTNCDVSHRVPYGDETVSNVLPGLLSANRPYPPTSRQDRGDRDISAYNSWPGFISKSSTASAVDEISGRQTLLPMPSESIPSLFSLNLSRVMPSVSRSSFDIK